MDDEEFDWIAFKRSNISVREVYVCDICNLKCEGYFECEKHLKEKHWKR